MRITVDKTLCTGHARCNAAAPDLFELDDMGYLDIEDQDVPATLEQRAQAGAAACPERAIKLK